MTTDHRARKKEYVRPIPATWWLSKTSYLRFMIRELSSGFIAAYAIFLLVLLRHARLDDPAGFQAFVDSLKSPVAIVLHLIALGFALFNTMTTFNVAPRILTIRRGEDTLPDATIAGAHYGAFLVASAVLIGIALMLH